MLLAVCIDGLTKHWRQSIFIIIHEIINRAFSDRNGQICLCPSYNRNNNNLWQIDPTTNAFKNITVLCHCSNGKNIQKPWHSLPLQLYHSLCFKILNNIDHLYTGGYIPRGAHGMFFGKSHFSASTWGFFQSNRTLLAKLKV